MDKELRSARIQKRKVVDEDDMGKKDRYDLDDRWKEAHLDLKLDEKMCPNNHKFNKIEVEDEEKTPNCCICQQKAYWKCEDVECRLNLFCTMCRAKQFGR